MNFVLAVLITLVTVSAAVIVNIAVSDTSYRQGQIDALSGKVYYELAKQADGSTIWVRKGAN